MKNSPLQYPLKSDIILYKEVFGMLESAISRYEYNHEMGRIIMLSSIYRPYLIEHTHGFVELVYITRGCGIHTIDGHTVRTRRGDIFLIDYGVKHNFQSISEPFEWINCIFRPELLCDVFSTQESAASLLYYIFYHNKLSDPNAVMLNMNLRSENEDVGALFEDMLREYTEKKHGYEDILEHYLMVILTKIARRIFSQTENTGDLSSHVDIIQDVREKLVRSEPGSISAKQLSDSYFLSQSSFSTKFKEKVGMSFLEYVIKLRIGRACDLLLTTDLQIGEIQSCTGYQDAKAFYRAFRRCTGMTPTEYRNLYAQSEDNK